MDVPTKNFNTCGAWKTPDPILTATDGIDPSNGFTIEYPEDYLIYPEGTFKNAEEFYADFDQAKIPFFEGFKIMPVDDIAEDGTANVCYKGAAAAVFLSNFLPVVLAATALNFLV